MHVFAKDRKARVKGIQYFVVDGVSFDVVAVGLVVVAVAIGAHVIVLLLLLAGVCCSMGTFLLLSGL